MLAEILPYLYIALAIALVVVASRWISENLFGWVPKDKYDAIHAFELSYIPTLIKLYPKCLLVIPTALIIILILSRLNGVKVIAAITTDNFKWNCLVIGLVAGVVIDRLLIKVDAISARLTEKGKSSTYLFHLGYRYYVFHVIVVSLLVYSTLPMVVSCLPIGTSSREILNVIHVRREGRIGRHGPSCNFKGRFLFDDGLTKGTACFVQKPAQLLQANSRVVAEGRQLFGIFAVERFQPLDVAE